MDYPKFTFMLEDKILPWKNGSAYFLNTAKQHHLFNAGSEDAYMIVLNVGTNPQTVNNTDLYQFLCKRNLSLTTKNTFTTRIKCSTKIRLDDKALFSSI